MAIVFEENLKKSMSSDKLLPVYVLFGEDGFLKKNYSDKILKLITEPDDVFNCVKFSSNCDLQDVYDAVLQLPFMAERKYIELYDFDFEKCSKSEFDRLCSLLEEVPDTATLVLRLDSVDFDSKKSSKFKRIMSAAEKAGGIAVKLDHRKPAELAKMLCDGAAKRGCKFDMSAAKFLIETAGDDINLLKNELEKLCAFANGGAITKETVETVCIKTVEASVYNLSKFIIECDVSSALKILDELFFMRVEPMIIFHTISCIYVDMFRVFAGKTQSVKINEISECFSYKARAFLLDKAVLNLRKFDRKKLELSFNALLQAEKSLKSFGADERIILEQLIIRLIYIIVKGESVDTP